MADETPPPNERELTGAFRAGAVPPDVNPDVFEVLSNRRRRYVLFSLLDAPGGVAELDELADQVRRWEREVDDEVPDDHGDRVVAGLYHVDVPRLADAGLVEFDPRSKAVRYRGDDALETTLELISSVERG